MPPSATTTTGYSPTRDVTALSPRIPASRLTRARPLVNWSPPITPGRPRPAPAAPYNDDAARPLPPTHLQLAVCTHQRILFFQLLELPRRLLVLRLPLRHLRVQGRQLVLVRRVAPF